MQNKNAGSILLIRCNKIISSDEKPTDEDLIKLSNSIKKYGVIQPIIIRPYKYGMFKIISGERRFSASKLAGLSSVPCIVIDSDKKTSAILNFIGNKFKKQYDIFEEASLIKDLILDYNLTLNELSDILSCDISDIIDRLKLLHFSRENIIKIKNSDLTFKQCKSLIKLENTEFFGKILDDIITYRMNEIQTEEYVQKILKNKRNTYILKDIKIFTNTISNAVDKIKNSGKNVILNKNENDEKIEYNIVISK